MVCGIDNAVIKRHHEAGGLENRTRFQPVRYGMVAPFVIFSRGIVAVHVYHGLDITRRHLHNYRHTGISIHGFQFLYEGAFGKVLYANVYRCRDVIAVNSGRVEHIHPAIEHLAAVLEAGTALQYGVVCQLKA